MEKIDVIDMKQEKDPKKSDKDKNWNIEDIAIYNGM